MPTTPLSQNTDDVDEYVIVDWVLPPTQLVDLRTARRALNEAGRRLTVDGHRVRCLYSTFMPAQRRWICLFAADSEDTVRSCPNRVLSPPSNSPHWTEQLIPSGRTGTASGRFRWGPR